MHRLFRNGLLAGAIALTGAVAPAMPALAQYEDGSAISFRYFRDQLASYGDWFYSDRWGEVWSPNVDASFQPYSQGYWAYTDDYGWLWSSDNQWGEITEHFGRWVNDPDDGWLWIPGYVWSPAWVVWRAGGDYTGWAPMPPTRAFLEGDESDFSISESGMYGYDDFYGPSYGHRAFASSWVFIDNRHFGERQINRFAIRDRARIIDFVRRTHNVTNYRIVGDRVVNRSIDVRVFERARGARIAPVPIARVVRRPSLVVNVNIGRQIQLRMRSQLPRGNGRPNSAPRLTPDRMHILGNQNARPPARLRDRTPGVGRSGQPGVIGGEGRNSSPQGNRPDRTVGPKAPQDTNSPDNAPGNAMRGPGQRGRDRNPAENGPAGSSPAAPGGPAVGPGSATPGTSPTTPGTPPNTGEGRHHPSNGSKQGQPDSGTAPGAPETGAIPGRNRPPRGADQVQPGSGTTPPAPATGVNPASPDQPARPRRPHNPGETPGSSGGMSGSGDNGTPTPDQAPRHRRAAPMPPDGGNAPAAPAPRAAPAPEAPAGAPPRALTPPASPNAPAETPAVPRHKKPPADQPNPPGTPQ